jgi:hypothetical protein
LSAAMGRMHKATMGCPSGVNVKWTTIQDGKGGRLVNELGLFAPMDRQIKRGDMIGMYTGEWRPTFEKAYTGCNRNVVEFETYRVLPVKTRLNPISRVNEPPPGAAANCTFVRWCDPKDVFAASSINPVDAISLHATRDLEQGEELFAYYGKSYARWRTYPIAEPAAMDPKPLTKPEIRSRGQQPSAIYPAIGVELPPDAWCAHPLGPNPSISNRNILW